MNARILVVDDEQDFTKLLGEALGKSGHVTDCAHTGYEALQMISFRNYDVAILDMLMPLVSGMETLKRIKKIDSNLPVIILTGDDALERAVQAMKLGAYDYLRKPIDWNKLDITISNALKTRGLAEEVIRLRGKIREKAAFDSVIGHSAKMKEVFRSIDRIADSDVTVSIRGESGTGKELLARAIHSHSSRRDGPFVTVNCAAIPESLLESELFGHERGAFTGAYTKRVGKFELADGGTIFLDEIGEMPQATQVKILRVLQERRFERVGGNKSIEADVRVISATNKNLEKEMKDGDFREDLYYRISVYPIFLPPLRERKADIPSLVEYFVESFNKRNRRRIKGISSKAMEHLIQYDWPGNVRELENVIERSLINTQGKVLLPEDLPITLIPQGPPEIDARAYMDIRRAVSLTQTIVPLKEIEKEVLKQALKLSNNNLSTTASALGIGRTTLYRKLQKYQIQVHR